MSSFLGPLGSWVLCHGTLVSYTQNQVKALGGKWLRTEAEVREQGWQRTGQEWNCILCQFFSKRLTLKMHLKLTNTDRDTGEPTDAPQDYNCGCKVASSNDL